MNLNRLIPVAGALLLVASALGGPALAESSSDDGPWQDSQDDSENETRASPDCSAYKDPEQREECRDYKEGTANASGDEARFGWNWSGGADASDPRPVTMEIPSQVAPDVDERREFYREQARDHRDFHREQQEDREAFLENQSDERKAFFGNLTERCLNQTSEDARNMTADEIRERLQERAENRTDCLQEFRAFLMEQQEDREAFLEDQRAAHEAYHDKLDQEREEFREEQRRKARQRAEDRHEEWEREAPAEERPGPKGAFSASDGSVDGRYVSFNYTADPAALADVSVKGIPVFDAAALDTTARHDFRGGAGFILSSEDGSMRIHDNPAVAFQIQPHPDTSWSLELAHHLNVTPTDDDERWRVTDGENLTGILHFADEPAYDEANVSFQGDDPVRFVVVPDDPAPIAPEDEGVDTASSSAVGPAMRKAMVEGTLGGEVNLAGPNGTLDDETVVYDDLDLSIAESEKGRVRFVVDGELETGRTIVVNAPDDLFGSENLTVSYADVLPNGTEEEVPIRLSDGVRDVMNPNDDSTPEYVLVQGGEGVQVMVSVPHFSAHAVTIQSVTEAAPPSVLAGALAALGFLTFAGVNLFRRRGGA